MYENLNIGNEIRYYRIKRKLSQEKLAEKSNLSLNFISKLETGRISNISLNKLLNICDALNVQLGKIVGDDITNTFPELPSSTIELIKIMSKLNYSKLGTISKDLIPLVKDFCWCISRFYHDIARKIIFKLENQHFINLILFQILYSKLSLIYLKLTCIWSLISSIYILN